MFEATHASLSENVNEQQSTETETDDIQQETSEQQSTKQQCK
jgi:hypothetical protein